MSFRGWPVEAVEFYEGLEADNSKAYWSAHRPVYDAAVKGPLDELLSELAGEFGPGRVFRPNRDIRFSADKSPYKTAIAATVGRDNYVQFSARGLGAGSGMWRMAPDQLKTAPRGYPRDHPRVDLLRNRGLITWKEWPAGAWLGKASAGRRVAELFRTARPLNEWLANCVGASQSAAP